MRLQHVHGEGVGADVLERREDVVDEEHDGDGADVVRRVRNEEHRAEHEHHPGLGEQDPRPSPAVGRDLVAVDDRTPEELDRPRQGAEGEQQRQFACTDAARGQEGHEGDRDEAPRDALSDVQGAERDDAGPVTVGHRDAFGRGLALELFLLFFEHKAELEPVLMAGDKSHQGHHGDEDGGEDHARNRAGADRQRAAAFVVHARGRDGQVNHEQAGHGGDLLAVVAVAAQGAVVRLCVHQHGQVEGATGFVAEDKAVQHLLFGKVGGDAGVEDGLVVPGQVDHMLAESAVGCLEGPFALGGGA